MGDMADDILDGIFCQVCGAVMDEIGDVPGYPQTCQACLEDDAIARDMEARYFRSRHGNRHPKHKRKGVNDNEDG